MTALDERSVVRSLGEVLQGSGLGISRSNSGLVLDLSGLDGPSSDTERKVLSTLASLLMRLSREQSVIAKLPAKAAAQSALADSGLMFALADLDAHIETGQSDSDSALFTDSPYRRLMRFDSWRDDFTPHSSDLRALVLSWVGREDDLNLQHVLTRAHLGVVGRDFLGLVNPHFLPNSDVLAAVTSTASPWLASLSDRTLPNSSTSVDDVLKILYETFENVIEHAWDGTETTQRSLITISRVGRAAAAKLRLQILDNGVGIPASLADRLNRKLGDGDAAGLVGQAFGIGDRGPLLPFGRGRGLPQIRQLIAELGGTLRLTTAAPQGRQVVFAAGADGKPKLTVDKRPVTGTVVAVTLPLHRRPSGAITGE